jgi:GxxExxY protein
LDDISRRVIGGALIVLIALGAGVLAKVQENALAFERRKARRATEQQRGLTITYDGIVVGDDPADPVVEQMLLNGLKAVNPLNEAHHAQRIGYLKVFGPRPAHRLSQGLRTAPGFATQLLDETA